MGSEGFRNKIDTQSAKGSQIVRNRRMSKIFFVFLGFVPDVWGKVGHSVQVYVQVGAGLMVIWQYIADVWEMYGDLLGFCAEGVADLVSMLCMLDTSMYMGR